MMTPISFSMLEFLKMGYIGPLCLALSCDEVRAILGDPLDWLLEEDEGRRDTSFIWKYGILDVVFDHQCTVKKIVLYPASLEEPLDLPEVITQLKGYPTAQLTIAIFQSYVKHNKLSYFWSKSPCQPRQYTFSVESATTVHFSVNGFMFMFISADGW